MLWLPLSVAWPCCLKLPNVPRPRVELTLTLSRRASLAEVCEALSRAPRGASVGELARALGQPAPTIHRLLGWRPDSRNRFRHDRTNPLPYDVVVVDETSMVSLTLLARLLEAVPAHARLVLVGDADQLTSVEGQQSPKKEQ